MNQLDTYYKALLEYKRIASSDKECEAFLRALSNSESTTESIELIRNVCTVDEDWVEAIEKGLIHIENAIQEERQFILSEGEIVPIEKAKSVSVESVKHLAKHSNLISRVPVDGVITPDSIYTVQRLNDYTVYENRFLYMLLCYLRDFISIRQEKIIEFSHKYEGSLTLEKALHFGGRRVSYRIDLKEESQNDPYLRNHNSNKGIIERISLIFRTVLSLLSTPLIEDAAKASMLKPPITKTNVLKMDQHFRGAVELYDFIMAYDKPGYTTKEEKRLISSFDGELSSNIAGICSALSFLTCENALDIKSELTHRYELQKEHQRAEEIRHYGEQIEQIKRKMQNGEIEAEEYILALEKKFGALEKAYESTEELTERLDSAESEILSLRAQNDAFDLKKRELDEALEAEIQRHSDEFEGLKAECDKRLAEAEAEYVRKTVAVQEALNASLSAAEKTHREELARVLFQLEQASQENENLKKEHTALLEERLISNARIKAILSATGELADDYADQVSFDQLEREYEAFKRFYKRQWKQAKRKIRKKLLNFEALRGQKGNDDE